MSMKTYSKVIGTAAVALIAVLTGAAVNTANASTAGGPGVVTVDVHVNPFGDTTAPDGKTIWVANSGVVGAPASSAGHTVTILDAQTLRILSVINVGLFPEDITFTHDGSQALVTNSTSDTVSVINTATRTVTQTVNLAPAGVADPFGIVATKDSSKVFVTTLGDTSSNSIAILNDSDSANVTLERGIGPAGFANRPALTPDGKLLVVPFSGPAENSPPETLLIDTLTNKVVGDLTLPTPGAPQAATVVPDGQFAYVSVFGGPYYGGTGGIWVINLATDSTVTVIQTPDTENVGVNTSPSGNVVFATDFSLGEVSVISTATNRVIANVTVGDEPNETAFTSDCRRAFVTNQGDTTVSVIPLVSCIPDIAGSATSQ